MILEKAQKILLKPVCNRCLGRQFAQLLSGFSNEERGNIIRTAVALSIDMSNGEKKGEPPKNMDLSNFSGFKFHNIEMKSGKKNCDVCLDLFEDLGKWTGIVRKSAKNIEFSTFLVGSKLSLDLIEREESLWERVGIDYCEPLKAEINREVGKLLEKSMKKRFAKNPDVNIILDFDSGKVNMKINPIFIYGEYQKLVRGIPQTRWPSGKYKTSVEQIIAKPFMNITKGESHKLHGCVSGKTIVQLNECASAIENLENEWKNHEIITFNENKKIIETSKIEDFMKLKQTVFLLRTKETCREIIASGEHPFYTPTGMKALADLKSGDKVAVNPETPEEFEIGDEKLILSENNITEVIKKNIEYKKSSYSKHIIEELEQKNLLPLYNTNNNLSIITRLVAFLFGDGNVKIIKHRDVGLEFYGDKIDLIRIQDDIKKIGFKSSIHATKSRNSIIIDYYGNDKQIKGSPQFKLTCYSKSLWILLVALGAPVGDKTKNNLQVPAWIKLENKCLKREFLATLLGCEIDTPRIDDRKYNRKSFNCPRFSMNKIESNIKNGIEFIEDLAFLLKDFDVKTYKARLVPYTTRKDGNKSIKIILDFSNKFDNLINLYGNVGLKYCSKKEAAARLCLEYLTMKNYIVSKRRNLFKKANLLKNQGYQLSDISKQLNSPHVSKKDLWLWIHNKIKEENIKIPNNFPLFSQWIVQATKDLKEGLIWETIDSIENRGTETVYDLTIPKNHNFFANGFLVSNCGREDIDARCLGWRPFVLEILSPNIRSMDLKKLAKKIPGKVKVRNIRLSCIKEVRDIKEFRAEKTYRALVISSKDIKKKDLAKLKSLHEINQKTPQRVLHRRADKYRKRHVKSVKARFINKKRFLLEVRGEAGLYIKELISGDEGRTRPSVSELLGTECKCIELDVMNIHTK